MINASNRKKAVELIDEAVASGARLYKACEVLKIHSRTYSRWKREGGEIDKRTVSDRPAPKNKLSEKERLRILEVINRPEYSSLPPSQIVPRLADEGIYICSESTMYRVMKEDGESEHRGHSKAPQKRAIPVHSANGINQVWMWDITYLKGPIKGQYYYLYLISDLFSRKIVGWEVWEEESGDHASELLRRSCINEQINVLSSPLCLHSDNGAPMKAATMLETIYALGIIPSRSRPSVSNDNPYAESLFKTLKYRPNYQPRGFKTLTEARLWVRQFVDWYNSEHKHSGISFVSPNERHLGLDVNILENRKKVYELAKEVHPERWSRGTRAWTYQDKVHLNPEKVSKDEQDKSSEKKAS